MFNFSFGYRNGNGKEENLLLLEYMNDIIWLIFLKNGSFFFYEEER